MDILALNDLALELVKRDHSDGHGLVANNGGPTKTSRALAIIHLAARDAYAKVTSAYPAKLAGLPAVPPGVGNGDASGTVAAFGAGIRAARLLYPDFATFIDERSTAIVSSANPTAAFYGAQVGERWVASRQADGASLPQSDSLYSDEPGHYRPDPVTRLPALGRTWGQVTPFVLASVEADAPLGPPPGLATQEYADAFDCVIVQGRDDIVRRNSTFRRNAAIGTFWGYDGANGLGTPPRLYNQVVVATLAFQQLPHADKINVLAAVNAAMADAGIAAWYWKYVYDFWRPITGIREAEEGWGPTGAGDGNALRKKKGNPFWLPLGAPRSNPLPEPRPGALGANFTPNFPAYPSGHATFGSACFETFAMLLGQTTDQISVTFVSGELDGRTTDNEGIVRPRWEQTITLQEADEQNQLSRIFLGVHWIFDATGGAAVGVAIAEKTKAAFS